MTLLNYKTDEGEMPFITNTYEIAVHAEPLRAKDASSMAYGLLQTADTCQCSARALPGTRLHMVSCIREDSEDLEENKGSRPLALTSPKR